MENMGLTALVTGGTGFIGSNLVRELINRNWNVFVLVRKNSKLGNKRIKDLEKVSYIYTDDLFDKKESKYGFPQFDACFHLAAYGVDYNQNNLYDIIDGNIRFIIDLLEFCKNNNTKKIINTGSCFEYGLNEGIKLNERERLNPNSYYATAKVACENIAKIFAKDHNLCLITVRPFGVFGENEGLHRLVPQLMHSVINQKPLHMTKGEQVRDYLYVKDLIEAYIVLALSNVPCYEVYNVCSSMELTIKELALKIAEISNADPDLFNFGAIEYRVNEVMHFVGDNSKIKKHSKWEPNFTLDQGIAKTFKWYKNNSKDFH